MKTNKSICLLAALLAVTTVASLSSCDDPRFGGEYTMYDYTAVSPSNWNELTYQDNNDTQIMSYISGSFFTFDFKFDANGEIVPGEFETEFSGAEALEDVTAEYAGDEKWGIPADAKEQRAYKITLRNSLRWDDGTKITAEDFVYSMQEQLNPLFKNYRADSFYNSGTVIHNAKGYVFQGSTENVTARDFHETWEEAKTDTDLFFSLGAEGGVGSFIATNYGSYLSSNTPAWVVMALGCTATEEEILKLEGKTIAEIEASDELSGIWAKVLGWWKTLPNEELDFFSKSYTYPEVKPEDIGLFVGEKKNELIIILDKTMKLLNEDGSLYYNAAYQLSSLPLVKKDLYESCKQEPQSGSTLWTSNYNSSVETSASWGPYKLTEFQAGKSYVLERNEEWYGYKMKEYDGQYQTSKIVVETISEYNTALLKFKAGELASIGIDVSVADEYKNSSQAIFTPDDFVQSMQLQSSKESLIARGEEDGVNKVLLAYPEFRKAISLGFDRADYAKKCTTSSLAGYGIFNSMHYYDVANGGVYRNTDEAKKTLCAAYGVDYTKFESLDAAVDSITGYNLELARQCLESAVAEAKKAGEYKDGDKVVFTVGTSVDNESTRRVFDFIKTSLETLAVGTSLEGLLTAEFDASFGNGWANDFRAGAYDICTGGWTGAAWDPGYFLLAYLSPDYMYSTAWDTSTVSMTFTMPAGDYEGAGQEYTMPLIEWYNCLNGIAADGATYTFDWSDGMAPIEARLALIAALEEQILTAYYTVPIAYSFGASLLSYKHEYITREYNTFMGYGGVRYMTYNYTDSEWEEYCANNELDYTI